MSSRADSPIERIVQWLASFTLRNRVFSLTWLIAATLFFAYHATSIQLYSQFNDLLPQAHPFIRNYKRFNYTFGGANVITLCLQVKNGDIFNYATLEKIKYVNDHVNLIDGINHYQVISIADVKLRTLSATNGGLIRSVPVMPDKVPADPAVIAKLKESILHNDLVYGRFVSVDGKAALILAGFRELRLDYANIHRGIMAIRAAVEDDNTRLYVAGEPMLKGWVYHYTGELAEIFAVTGAIIVVMLVFYFRRAYGVLLPIIGTAVQAIWGLGFLGVLGYNMDPLALVIPLLVSARAASHSVQMIERYFEEFELHGEKHRAVVGAMREMLLPGVIGVLADAAGILVLAVATIPLIRKLAFFASFWGFSNIFAILMLIPLLLDILPTPRKTEHYVPRWMVNVLHKVGDLCTSRGGGRAVLALAAIVTIAGIHEALHVRIGETEAGSPLLWRDSDYNVSARMINTRFAGENALIIYLAGDDRNALKDPAVLDTLDDLRRFMLEQPQAGGTRDLPTLVRGVNRLFHYNDPAWALIPRTLEGVGNMVFMYEAGAPVPGVVLQYMDYSAQDGQFAVFYKDSTGATIAEAIYRARRFAAAHRLKHVKFVLAGGAIGVTAALNEEIAHSDRTSTILIILVIFTLVSLSYMSIAAGAMVMVTLVAAGVVSFLYIGLRGIGMNINTLPVTAVGMGIGVDYILYVVDRIKREYERLHDYEQAIRRALSTCGMAVTFTATTMVAGVLPWYFLSNLRFSAEMALLLAILMITHWLAAITLVPSIFALVRPKFISRGIEPPQSSGARDNGQAWGAEDSPRIFTLRPGA